VKKLAASNSRAVVEILRERLAEARIAVALYDRILEDQNVRELPESDEVAEALDGLRAQELEHVAFVTSRLERLGGSTLTVPRRHLRGFEELARTPDARVADLVAGLWALECAQDGAWDLFHRLARGVDDGEAATELERRAREEHAHAVLLRDIIQSAVRDRLRQPSDRLAA
jgi:hypothetical protein